MAIFSPHRTTNSRISLLTTLFCLFLLPASLAQGPLQPIALAVVGNNHPVDSGHYCDNFAGLDRNLTDCYLAQNFTLGSAAFVNRLDLTLIASPFDGTSQPTNTINIVLTTHLKPLGLIPAPSDLSPFFLSQTVTVSVAPSRVDAFIPISISFPTILLPKGSYDLVLFSNSGPSVTWAPNLIGSSEIGTLGGAFCTTHVSIQCSQGSWQPITVDTDQPTNLSGTDGTFAFQFSGPLTLPPSGGGYGQIIRLVVAGPVTPTPGEPVEAHLSFVDLNGNPIGPNSNVTVRPGQIQSLDLNLAEVARPGQRVEIVPLISQVPGVAGVPQSPTVLSATVQTLDGLIGFETSNIPLLQPGANNPVLLPQVLGGGQIMRINASASPSAPCNATLGFADNNGAPLGTGASVHVSPSTITSLDLNSYNVGLSFGRRIEVWPIITPTSIPGAVTVDSACFVSVEVFDRVTSRTWSTQSTVASLPAVQ
jgi:hypothetical protein